MLTFILEHAAIFLLVFARCFALILTVPLLSSRSVSRAAKIALAGYMAFLIFPHTLQNGLEAAYGAYSAFSANYLMLLLGEAMIGVITGFFVSLIFAAFSTAGQFFSFQSGMSMSEVYDALSQVENPILGQYLNLIAMILFLQVQGFQRLFLGGLLRSWQSLNALSLITARDTFYRFLASGLTELFFNAFVIALPVMGVLLLVTVGLGLISKAAPQMELRSEGLPLTVLTTFLILMLLMPALCEFFIHAFDAGFAKLERLFIDVGGAIP
jgi:flagellar biosynthetic protein FliR